MQTSASEATATAPGFVPFFHALSDYITRMDDLSTVPTRTPTDSPIRKDAKRLEALARLMLNSWSAEYALRITPLLHDEQYLTQSLHWTFPQAYYSVLFSAKAFLFLSGLPFSDENTIRKGINAAVVCGIYPPSLGFYLSGPYLTPTAYRLTDAPETMVRFLENTRHRQTSGQPAINTADSAEKARWGRLTGYTTYFDALTRLRISSTEREVERLPLSGFDVLDFHRHLVNIVGQVNAVHEALLKQTIGQRLFHTLVDGLPEYLQTGFLADRHPKK